MRHSLCERVGSYESERGDSPIDTFHWKGEQDSGSGEELCSQEAKCLAWGDGASGYRTEFCPSNEGVKVPVPVVVDCAPCSSHYDSASGEEDGGGEDEGYGGGGVEGGSEEGRP